MGAEFWYTPEMGTIADLLIGDYLIDVDITTAERPNPIKDRNESVEYATFMMNPAVTNFLAMKGKQVDISVIEDVVKSYGKNPKTAITDIASALPPQVGINPTTPITTEAGAVSPIEGGGI